jgi:hypothetical protein
MDFRQRSKKNKILLFIIEISSNNISYSSSQVFNKESNFSIDKDCKCLQFNGRLSTEWIVVPSILNVILHVYTIKIAFCFKGSKPSFML